MCGFYLLQIRAFSHIVWQITDVLHAVSSTFTGPLQYCIYQLC
jgi:hypothetical protein